MDCSKRDLGNAGKDNAKPNSGNANKQKARDTRQHCRTHLGLKNVRKKNYFFLPYMVI